MTEITITVDGAPLQYDATDAQLAALGAWRAAAMAKLPTERQIADDVEYLLHSVQARVDQYRSDNNPDEVPQAVLNRVMAWLAGDETPVPTEPTLVSLEALHAGHKAAAAAEYATRYERSVVTVPIASTGAAQPFGCDANTVTNIMGITVLIAQQMAGLLPAGLIPNPRPFTPSGGLAPVAVTHAEFASIGALIAARKDTLYAAYLGHKVALQALYDAGEDARADLEAYDTSAGWPA